MVGEQPMSLSTKLKSIVDQLADLRKEYIEATDTTSRCDKIEQDLLHRMELEKLTYHETASLAIELRSNRIERRIAKDTVRIYRGIFDLSNDGQYKHIISKLKQCDRDALAEENKLKNRIYKERGGFDE